MTGSALLGPFIADAAKTSLTADSPQRITAAIIMRLWSRDVDALAVLARSAQGSTTLSSGQIMPRPSRSITSAVRSSRERRV
jgi:hypothetical protein